MENVCLNRKNNNALNNQAQMSKIGSIDSDIANPKIWLRKLET